METEQEENNCDNFEASRERRRFKIDKAAMYPLQTQATCMRRCQRRLAIAAHDEIDAADTISVVFDVFRRRFALYLHVINLKKSLHTNSK